MSAKSFSGDNTVIPDSIDENESMTNVTTDESYTDVENTSAKDTTDTEILSSVCDPKMNQLEGKIKPKTQALPVQSYHLCRNTQKGNIT